MSNNNGRYHKLPAEKISGVKVASIAPSVITPQEKSVWNELEDIDVGLHKTSCLLSAALTVLMEDEMNLDEDAYFVIGQAMDVLSSCRSMIEKAQKGLKNPDTAEADRKHASPSVDIPADRLPGGIAA